jgi:hypothetical protein
MDIFYDIDDVEKNSPYKILEEWRKKTEAYSKFHAKEEKICDVKGKLLTFLSIILASIAGISSFIETSISLTYFLGSLAILSSIIQSFVKYLRYESLEYKHHLACIRYEILTDNISLTLNSENDEEKLKDYCRSTLKILENLLKSSPSINTECKFFNN